MKKSFRSRRKEGVKRLYCVYSQIYDLINVSEILDMMALLSEDELVGMISRLEQQEIDCQTGSGTVPGKLNLSIFITQILDDKIVFFSICLL